MGKVRWQVVHKNGQELVEEIHKVVFHKVNMGDVEDPDLMVAQPIWDWQQTPAGQFAMNNTIPQTMSWERNLNPMHMGWTYIIYGEMEKKKLSEYYLRFGKVTL